MKKISISDCLNELNIKETSKDTINNINGGCIQ